MVIHEFIGQCKNIHYFSKKLLVYLFIYFFSFIFDGFFALKVANAQYSWKYMKELCLPPPSKKKINKQLARAGKIVASFSKKTIKEALNIKRL